jgi:hypothetical protein
MKTSPSAPELVRFDPSGAQVPQELARLKQQIERRSVT